MTFSFLGNFGWPLQISPGSSPKSSNEFSKDLILVHILKISISEEPYFTRYDIVSFQIYQNHLPETTKTTNFSRFSFASTSSVGVCCDCGAEGWNLAGHDQFWVGEHMWANNFSLLCLSDTVYVYIYKCTMYIYIYRRGHPQSAAFSLVLLHVRWQFLLGTSAMAMSLLCNHWQFLLGIS